MVYGEGKFKQLKFISKINSKEIVRVRSGADEDADLKANNLQEAVLIQNGVVVPQDGVDAWAWAEKISAEYPNSVLVVPNDNSHIQIWSIR